MRPLSTLAQLLFVCHLVAPFVDRFADDKRALGDLLISLVLCMGDVGDGAPFFF